MVAMSFVPTSETARATPSGPWLYAVIVSGQVSSMLCRRVKKRGAAASGRRVVCPRVVAPTLRCGERLRLRPRGVEAEQQRTQAVELDVGLEALEARELALAEAVVEAGAEVEDLVDLVEMDRVVQNHLVRRVLGEDGAPEADLRLELRGAREEVRLT